MEDITQSTFYKAGAEDAKRRIPITKSRIRIISPYCRQYDEFIAGYDSVAAARKKRKTKCKSGGNLVENSPIPATPETPENPPKPA